MICKHLRLFALIGLSTLSPLVISATTAAAQNLDTILERIEALEGKSDPKCYATASRLEDFIFGTPLTLPARSLKNELQQDLVRRIWMSAAKSAASSDTVALDRAAIEGASQGLVTYTQDAQGHWNLEFPAARQLRINGTDKRQYSSIAYSLRAILGVQQSMMLGTGPDLPPLTQGAVDELKTSVDLFTLAALRLTDEIARSTDQSQVRADTLLGVWQNLLDSEMVTAAQDNGVTTARRGPADLSLIRAVIEKKVSAYAKYNAISNQLFVRNLQVFFAKMRWPESSKAAREFRQLFTESLISMTRDIYRGSESVALARGATVIKDRDVAEFIDTFMPHVVNAYEDAIFFPRLARREQVTIEAYDMDAFRDSGIHWRYLQFAIDSDGFEAALEPDPFALELITESVAQLGTLLLRLTGETGNAQSRERLQVSDLSDAITTFSARAAANAAAPEPDDATGQGQLASADEAPLTTDASTGSRLFTEVTGSAGIDYMHRSSDWLSRLLRSYLSKDASTGIITIPPAFGGSGIAVADVNNDDLDDILFVGGLGNRLYVNTGDGSFADMTGTAGLAWTREADKRPGEARQPLIADLDNDGDQDIVITYVNDAHRVYRNNGDGRFTDVTDIAGLGGEALVGGPATVFDFNNDGLLDIYITYFGNYLKGILPTLKRRNSNGLPNQLFLNKGDFRFANVTSGSGLDNSGWAQAVTHTDLNGDGSQDVIVGNDFGVNAYYLNNADGTFSDIAPQLETDKPSYTMGIGITDLNGDLLPDFYISNIVTMNKDQKYVLPEADTTMVFNPDKLSNMRVVEANDLFLSYAGPEGTRYALSDAVGRGYSSTGWAWGAEFFDSDNDGDDDLYVLNGMNEFNVYSSENPYYTDPISNQEKNIFIPVDTRETNVFFQNAGGKLNNVSRKSGLDIRSNSRSAAYLDYDGDGDLDIVLNNYHEAARFFRNDAVTGNTNWLKIKLRGNPDAGVNLDAIGSRVIVRHNDGRTVMRELHGSSGYMTVQSKTLHAGVGGADRVDVEIYWPNGELQMIEAVPTRQTLTVDYQGPETKKALR